jgi:small-conductance mechanosensitive channel
LKSRIRNYKRQLDRRIVFTTDVTYATPAETIARIPGMIREVVSTQQPVRFDRSHFTQYTDSSLRIETVYFVLDADYARYLDIQQTINLELLRRFNAEKIEFAFPTRTIVLESPFPPATHHQSPSTSPQSTDRIQPPSTAID